MGGTVGPAEVGWLKDPAGSYAGGLYGLAVSAGSRSVIAAVGLHIPRRAGAGAIAPAE